MGIVLSASEARRTFYRLLQCVILPSVNPSSREKPLARLEVTAMDEFFTDESLTRESVAAAVDALVAELLHDARISAPPVDALTLARAHLGLEVVAAERARPRSEER